MRAAEFVSAMAYTISRRKLILALTSLNSNIFLIQHVPDSAMVTAPSSIPSSSNLKPSDKYQEYPEYPETVLTGFFHVHWNLRAAHDQYSPVDIMIQPVPIMKID